MDIREEYECANAILETHGLKPIEMPRAGSDRENLQHLIDAYIDVLYTLKPEYKKLPAPRLIPDMLLDHLFAVMDEYPPDAMAEEIS